MTEDKKDPQVTTPSTMTFEVFHSKLKDQLVNQLVEIDRLPTKEEIIKIASNPFEVIFIVTEDNKKYSTKWEEGYEFERFKEQVGKVILIAHTHIPANEGSEEKSKFFSSLPSTSDLTSKSSGAEINYIFNTFGRIAFWPAENRGPKTEGEFGDKSMSQQVIGNAMRVGAKEARQQGIKDIPKIINYIGDYIGKIFGTQFQFTDWKDVRDPFS
ncbi:MAG TPA: hypothetical protein VF185_01880 [Patescibacteria group bacterium]